MAVEEEGGGLWGKLVDLTQTAFREGGMAEEAMWQTMVLIPKAAPYEKAYRETGNGGWRPWGRMWGHYWGGGAPNPK